MRVSVILGAAFVLNAGCMSPLESDEPIGAARAYTTVGTDWEFCPAPALEDQNGDCYCEGPGIFVGGRCIVPYMLAE